MASRRGHSRVTIRHVRSDGGGARRAPSHDARFAPSKAGANVAPEAPQRRPPRRACGQASCVRQATSISQRPLPRALNCHAGVAAPTRWGWGSPRTTVPWEAPASPRVLASVRRHIWTPCCRESLEKGLSRCIGPGFPAAPDSEHELLASAVELFGTGPLTTGDLRPSLDPSPVEVGRPARVSLAPSPIRR